MGASSVATTRRPSKASFSCLSRVLVVLAAAVALLVVFYGVYTTYSSNFSSPVVDSRSRVPPRHRGRLPDATFYDDPSLSYAIDRPVADWDAKRREWRRLNPHLAGDGQRILMVSGSQPGPCRNPVGDHLLLRLFKNKADYCRRHGIELFYNTALLHPKMGSYWAKIPAIRAAMLAHPEAEWVWWVDSDAAFTDMDSELPMGRYRFHNMVLHGWAHLVYEKRSWVSLNAGVFLIRNCQWSLDFMAEWASMSPISPDYARWGKILKEELNDKLYNESDDQSALVYILLKQKERWGDKIYLESEFELESYWLKTLGRLEEFAGAYAAVERQEEGMRRRHAEPASRAYGRMREKRMMGVEKLRRPLITHFTGCQPCSGDLNKMYTAESCWEGMQRALHFADDQVLRDYGFRHANLLTADVIPLPFDYPAATS
ncbi:probable glycosyltransferase 7 [Zingiber officinale]|uniref:probable glycosyltransferase 7 n=1 Tax=Zingiber officinale TaxID=94328 RepID=UPI001C4B16B1|nr:probable glycosyltransferase 7 [Zingiber officinale]